MILLRYAILIVLGIVIGLGIIAVKHKYDIRKQSINLSTEIINPFDSDMLQIIDEKGHIKFISPRQQRAIGVWDEK